MNSLLEKIKRSVRCYFYKYRNNWTFPPNIAHLTGGKMAKGTYEPQIKSIIEKNLKKGDIFIDIGANVGYFSRLASEAVKESGNVYAFEMEHLNYYALYKNTAFLKNVTPFNFAVSNEHRLISFFRSSHSSSHSIFDTSKNLDGSQFSVPSITLDYFWITYLEKKEIHLIKIDVEGAELLVLEGMEKMLSENKVEAIILEFHPEIILNTGKDYQILYSILNKNFVIYLLKDNSSSIELKSLKQFNQLADEVNSKKMIFYCKKKI